MTGAPAVPFYDLGAVLAPHRAALDAAWARVLASGRFVLGDELAAFEAEFAGLCGTAHAVGTGNGLDALRLALQALGIGPGDDVLVPAHTFIATWLAVAATGATPVPVEPDPATALVDAAAYDAAATPRTRAVLAVHLYGALGDIAAIAALCRRRGFALVEDAAQAHGAALGDRRAGAFGDIGCFSFYPSKNLGALGDGGAVVTSDAALADRVRALRNYGGVERYRHDIAGTNSRLDELQAALLRVRLRALDAENARRRAIAARLLDGLHGIAGLGLPVAGAAGSHAWHLFVVQHPARDALAARLAASGVQTLVHYPAPPYRHPPFAAFAPHGESVSDRLCARVLSLPMGTHLSDAQVDRVVAAVAAAAGHAA